MRPLLALVMMVKDEGETIAKTIESVRSYVNHITIVDTGSTDDTIEKIKEATKDVPYRIYNREFVDFSTTRNEALDTELNRDELGAESAIFTLMLSGGETLINPLKLGEFCEAEKDATQGAYLIGVSLGTNRFYSSRLIRTDSRWRYKGKTHEVLMPPEGHEGELATVKIPGCHILHEKDVTTEKQRNRWMQDAKLLEQAIEEDSTDCRSTFYLAQTYECLGQVSEALDLYRLRSNMKDGFWEEVYISKLSILKIGKVYDERSFIGNSVALYEEYPHRMEPLYEAALFCYERGKLDSCAMFARWALRIPYPANDLPRVDYSIYSWRIHDLVACSAGDNHLLGMRACEQALKYVPHDERILKNFKFFLAKCEEQGLFKRPAGGKRSMGGDKYQRNLQKRIAEKKRLAKVAEGDNKPFTPQ